MTAPEGTPVSQDEFLAMVRGFRVSAFRFEAQDSYGFKYEQEEFARYVAGTPRTPDQIEWWQAWLNRVRECVRDGKTICRVRLLDTPPTPYQQWLVWGTRFHAEAGEDIRYLLRAEAGNLGLPDHDWWLLDDENVIVMAFTEGKMDGASLVTGAPAARYRAWRAMALTASSAGPVTA